ncbi:hypothetical protein [Streptomyces sp. NPDC001980]|uniref:hypothetical protein n=1 Tax=Streptomyces sp. NPDC001980 TaxID=3157126 RepID=UPI00331ABCCB
MAGLETNPPRLMTRLQLDNAVRHALRTAREAQAVLRDPNRRAEDEHVLAELLLDFGEMTGSPGLLQLVEQTSGEEVVRLVAEAALFVRAHNWPASHLRAILQGTWAGQEQPHAGESLVSEFLEDLGTLRLVESGDGADWGFRILKAASMDDEKLTAVVKAARYLLQPSSLMVFGDVTEILGKAVYATNVKRFSACLARIRALTTERLPPPGPGREDPLGDRRSEPRVIAEPLEWEPQVPSAQELWPEDFGPAGSGVPDDGVDPNGARDLGEPGRPRKGPHLGL